MAVVGSGAVVGPSLVVGAPTSIAFVDSLLTSGTCAANVTTNVTLGTVTPPAGATVIVKAGSGSTQLSIGAVTDSAGHAWTQRGAVASTTAASAKLWTTTATGAAMAVTVAFTCGAGPQLGVLAVEWYTGASIAAAPSVGLVDGDVTVPYTGTLAAHDPASLVSWVAVDYFAPAGTAGYSAGGIVTEEYRNTPAVNFWSGYQAAPATPGTATYGMTAPTGQKTTLIGIELLPAGTTAPPPTTTPAAAGLELGVVGWVDQQAAQQCGTSNLGAPVMRAEFTIGQLTLATTVADYCNAAGIRLQPLIGWDNGTPAPDLTGLATWASTLGPGGSHWGGASPVAAIREIELGNENSMFYKSGLPGDAGYQSLATTYGNRALAAAQAINTANPAVGVLVELEGGDSNQSVWIDKVLTAGGATLKSLMRGPVIHLYGPAWQTKLDLNRGFLAAQGVTKPYYITETGISSDNGRNLSDNFGYPTNLTYSQAAVRHQAAIEGMAGQPSKIKQAIIYNNHDTANPGASNDREAYFGITTAPFGDKGAITTYFRTAFAQYRGVVSSAPLSTLVDTFTTAPIGSQWTVNGAGVQDGQLYVNATQNAGVPVFSSARSAAGYTFTGSSLMFELKAVPGIAGNTVNAQAWVMDPTPADTVDRIGFEYVGATNTLDCLGQTGATYTPIGTTTSLTYDPVAHRWLRIAHSGTAITWQTSPDGLTWTTRRTLSTGIPTWTTKTTLIASFEASRTTGTNDTLRIDNVNTTPTTIPGAQPVGADALQRRTLNELRTWKSWLVANGNAKGLVGEFNGVTLFRKYNDIPQGAQWDALLDIYLRELDYQGIHSAAWASGRNWGQGYPLGIHVGVNPGDPLTIANQNASAVLASHPTRGGVLRSVNLSGHEEGILITGGGTVRTGGPYLHTVADFQFLAANGVDTIRLPLAWERLQPTLSTALSTTALGALDTMLGAARQVGIRVMLDCHNYGRYTLADGSVYSLGGNLTNAMFSDFWTRLSTWVRADTSRSSTVVAYALMNEPHSLAGGAPTWETSSQAALSAIRTGGDTRLVFVGGYTFSSLTEWATWHPDGWITDPANNFAYEAHHYWDTQSAIASRSGTYQQSPTGPIETYAIELAAAVNTEGTPPAAPSVSAGADATVGFGSTFARTATETGVGITTRAWTVVSGPLGAGTTLAAGTASLSWLPGSSPVGTADIRYPTFAEMAFEMTSTAENSTLDWTSVYGYVEDIGDERGYTAGLVGFCSGTGDMLELVQYYASIAPGNELQGYIPGLQQTTAVGQGPNASDAAATYLGASFIAAWKSAANNDPKFRRAQRDKRDELYWLPALAQALDDEVGPLGLAILYDISVNHGIGEQPEAFGGIVASAHAAASPPSSGGDEEAYLRALIDERVAILQGWGAYQTDGRQTIHEAILAAENLQLEGPVTWSVYGDAFTMGPRPNPPQDAVRGTYVLRYTAANGSGTGTDDVTVAVIDPLPEGGDNGTDPIIVQTLTVYGNAVGPLFTETFLPAAGEVLVVKAVTGHSLNTIASGSVAGGGLVYHERGAVTATSYCQARLWTTTVGSSPVAMSVSVTTAGTAYSPTLIVERWHNVAIAA